MISKYKRYYTKLGYVAELTEHGRVYCLGYIPGGENYTNYFWNTESGKCFRKITEDGDSKDFEDEDYDLVENRESFEKVEEVKEDVEKLVGGVLKVKDGSVAEYKYTYNPTKVYTDKISSDINWDDYVSKLVASNSFYTNKGKFSALQDVDDSLESE